MVSGEEQVAAGTSHKQQTEVGARFKVQLHAGDERPLMWTGRLSGLNFLAAILGGTVLCRHGTLLGRPN